jgi:uncharacterized protein
MRTVERFPHEVTELEHVLIPMSDGANLAARIWMPQGAEDEPVPAILEYIPYRKRDHRTPEDSVSHPYVAGHGYVVVRVDLRGSGDSDGVLTDEYLRQEWDDGLEVLDWIAEQPWCDGAIGMLGISWGGFNGLQLAALQPPQLRAVITVASTDDRYADDVHYMGGCLLADNLSWASVMFANNSCPPDPELVGPAWRTMWHERLEGSGLWLDTWLQHQELDDYWKHGSVCEDYAAIQCPVFAISGWGDGYSNAVFRLVANLDAPAKGLIGPWSHRYPHLARAEPRIGFLQESLRWWDHWLKGRDTGVMDEPTLRVWMQEAVPPATRYDHRPGRWVAESSWPSPTVAERSAGLEVGGGLLLDATSTIPGEQRFSSPLRTGLLAGKWCSYAAGPDLPGDQREDDANSLTFDSEPLEEQLEILGAPVVELEVAVDRPVAMLAVRLCDVDEFGASTRVTYGLLNLTHRDSHEHPTPLEPGHRERVEIRLNEVAYAFQPGRRLRLAVSTSYWPLAWPPPDIPVATVWPADSRLRLPVRAPRDEDATLPELPGPEGAPPVSQRTLEPGIRAWRLHRDLETDEFSLEVDDEYGVYVIEETDTVLEMRGWERYSACGDDPTSAEGRVRWVLGFRRSDWDVRTETETVLRCTSTAFLLEASLLAFEDGLEVFRKTWDQRIERRWL